MHSIGQQPQQQRHTRTLIHAKITPKTNDLMRPIQMFTDIALASYLNPSQLTHACSSGFMYHMCCPSMVRGATMPAHHDRQDKGTQRVVLSHQAPFMLHHTINLANIHINLTDLM